MKIKFPTTFMLGRHSRVCFGKRKKKSLGYIFDFTDAKGVRGPNSHALLRRLIEHCSIFTPLIHNTCTLTLQTRALAVCASKLAQSNTLTFRATVSVMIHLFNQRWRQESGRGEA